MAEPEDRGAALYARYLAGDDSAFVAIVTMYQQRLVRFAMAILGNIHDAEDVAEDTLLVVVMKRRKYKGRGSFDAWIFTIAHNKALDHLKKNKRLVYSEDVEGLDEQVREPKTPESELLAAEQGREVFEALASLKDEYRLVLYLSYMEGLSNPEISLVMRKSRRQVENLMYRAKCRLREYLEADDFKQATGAGL